MCKHAFILIGIYSVVNAIYLMVLYWSFKPNPRSHKIYQCSQF